MQNVLTCRHLVWPQPPPMELMLELQAAWQQQQEQQQAAETQALQPSLGLPATKAAGEVTSLLSNAGMRWLYCSGRAVARVQTHKDAGEAVQEYTYAFGRTATCTERCLSLSLVSIIRIL